MLIIYILHESVRARFEAVKCTIWLDHLPLHEVRIERVNDSVDTAAFHSCRQYLDEF